MDSEYEGTQAQSSEYTGPSSHPYLHEPLLYISNLPSYVTDENLAMALVSCGPFRPRIPRDTAGTVLTGTVEFKDLEKAEKALATLQSRPMPGLHPPVPLVLSPYPPTTPPTPLPPPSALPRVVKHLPVDYTDGLLYDLFRPFGALASARTHTHMGPDTGMVEFWSEDDARLAEEAMHCSEVEGQTIAVTVYQPRRSASGGISDFSPSAPSFVPSFGYPAAAQYSPPRPHPYQPPHSPPTNLGSGTGFVHGPGQQVQLAPLIGPGSNSHSGLIDPCNLFCKNLDPDIDSNSLFSHFRQFGQIVSARVMRNENGESRGFGFVSYQTPDQASAAMHAMNGLQLGTKQIVVRLHEPKQLRQEKLAQRFGHGGHPRNSSGATSPTASEGGDSYGGWGSPRRASASLGSPQAPDRGRRGSGSYYNAALTGTLNLPMRYDDLATLSPVVRKEVLTGELSRRIKTMDIVPSDDIDAIVESMVSVSLSEIVQVLEDSDKLANHVQNVQRSIKGPDAPFLSFTAFSTGNGSPEKSSRSASASQDSRFLDPGATASATASAPEHPSTPLSIGSTPPRTSSPSGSVPPTSERDRMLVAVSRLEKSRQDQLTDLMMSLPKRERAMCLFNAEVLRAKLADAKLVLESSDDEEERLASVPPVPSTPQNKRTSKVLEDSPRTPDLSSRGPSATASPMPSTPSGPSGSGSGSGNDGHTLASIAKLPAAEIYRLMTSANPPNLPISKPDALVVQATDEFMDGLLTRSQSIQKQQVGDKLFKIVKSFGIKGAPKITIALLDQEDLRALSHLMNSYPSILKEKASQIAPK